MIRSMSESDLPQVLRLWNTCAESGDMLYLPMEPDRFRRKFMEAPFGCDPDFRLVAAEGDQVLGFLHGVPPLSFPLAQPGDSFLTVLLVSPAFRGRGIGRALCAELISRLRSRGARNLQISNWNPVDLPWRIPGAPGHDHNNAPGLDLESASAGFFAHLGFSVRVREIAMYTSLAGWEIAPEVKALQTRLRAEGIETGPYDPALNYDYGRMCDGVQSDYWRDVLSSEIAAWKAGQPNPDSRFWADDAPPRGPRTLLTATHDHRIVGFTGPVDLQRSGRGWFTGICTDPGYEKRGIATVLFSLLLQAFREEGAAFATLFTGEENHAQKIYLRAGLRIVRRFGLMRMELPGEAT